MLNVVYFGAVSGLIHRWVIDLKLWIFVINRNEN